MDVEKRNPAPGKLRDVHGPRPERVARDHHAPRNDPRRKRKLARERVEHALSLRAPRLEDLRCARRASAKTNVARESQHLTPLDVFGDVDVALTEDDNVRARNAAHRPPESRGREKHPSERFARRASSVGSDAPCQATHQPVPVPVKSPVPVPVKSPVPVPVVP